MPPTKQPSNKMEVAVPVKDGGNSSSDRNRLTMDEDPDYDGDTSTEEAKRTWARPRRQTAARQSAKRTESVHTDEGNDKKDNDDGGQNAPKKRLVKMEGVKAKDGSTSINIAKIRWTSRGKVKLVHGLEVV
ncbi:hypothetical protein N0V90_000803 [Kalmusia sp. IMI 367209]|nr:hypothetical protein N0V90_000803 [Kalmusia sp. IMI 367209]